jgi:hypothetical protein
VIVCVIVRVIVCVIVCVIVRVIVYRRLESCTVAVVVGLYEGHVGYIRGM